MWNTQRGITKLTWMNGNNKAKPLSVKYMIKMAVLVV